jgi:pimeloyl-ACP methyl ester carboxylesterase
MKHVKKTALSAWIVVLLVVSVAGLISCRGEREEKVATVASADGSSIAYGVRGQGERTIVFIHCWTCNQEFWRPQIEHFAGNYRVAWLDLAGHGLSDSNRREYTMAAFGQDVAAVVNEIGAKNVVLVGHSMGGPVAIEAAGLLGEKVIGIVGVDTFYTSFEHPVSEEEMEGFVKPFKEDFKGTSTKMVLSMFTPEADPDVKAAIVKQMSAADQEMAVSAMYEILSWSAQSGPAGLAKYADKLRNINAAPTGKETAKHESVVLVPGVGHFIPQVKPDEFNEVLEKIVAGF